jgi:uncharacterized lipoprotein YmbA
VLKVTDPAPVITTGQPLPSSPLIVGLGPITVPDYLDRADVVRRASDNRLAMASNERWGETLRAGLQRVLAADLARDLGPEFWVTSGSDRVERIDVEVPIDVESFEPDAAGRVALITNWRIHWLQGEHRSILERTRQGTSEPITGTEDQVRAMSNQIEALADTLAAAIKTSHATPTATAPSTPPLSRSSRHSS